MKNRKLKKKNGFQPHYQWLLWAVALGAGVVAWMKLMDSLEPEVDDGEADGEIDPDLPFARPGDVLLFNRATGLNRLITTFTRSPYYHVGIAMGDNKVVEARPRGVVVRDLTGPDGDKRFEIIPFENLGGEDIGLKALEWAKLQVGEGYDPVNVLSIVMERCFTCCAWSATLPDRWSCGEFVAVAFLQAGENLLPEMEPAASVPADFARYLPS